MLLCRQPCRPDGGVPASSTLHALRRQEPNRAVQLLKTPGTGAPQTSLAAAAAAVTPAELQVGVLALWTDGRTPQS